jgi:hypothetical protein
MEGGFSVTQDLLGPLGGQLALAFGAGCAAGYAFCLRTVHKMLGEHAQLQYKECLDRVETMQRANDKLQERVTTLEERLYSGTARQMAQIRESELRVLGADKLGRYPIGEEDR